MKSGWIRPCVRFAVARPVLGALVALAALITIGAGAAHLEVKTGYRGMFSDTDPLLADIEAMNARYAAGDGLLFVLRAAEGSVFTPSGLAAIRSATERLRALSSVRTVTSLATVRRATRTAFGMIAVDVIPKRPPPSRDALLKLRRTVLGLPSVAGRLISEDGGTALIRAEFDLAHGDAKGLSDIMAQARALKRRIEAEAPGHTVALGGLVALNSAFVEAATHDARVLFPFMAGLLCLGLWLFTRSLRGVAGPLTVVVAAVATAMGAAGWLDVPVTPVLSVAPTIILGIGIADGLHVLVGADRARAAGLAPAAALYRALRHNLTPICLTTLTTAVGFLSLMFSKSPPFQELGLVTAVGVVAALFYTVTLLPMISLIAPGRIQTRFHRLERAVSGLAGWSHARRRLAIALTAVMLGVAALGFLNARTDDRFADWFDRSTEFRQNLETIRQGFGPTERASWIVPLRDGLASVDAGLLDDLDAFATWLTAQPEVSHVASLSSILSDLAGASPGDARRTAALAVFRRLARPDRVGRVLAGLLAVDGGETRLLVTLKDGSTGALRALQARSRTWLANRSGALTRARIAGPAWSLASLVSSSAEAMLTGTAIAFLVIATCLAIYLRSVRLGVSSLVAMTVPPAFVYGVWSLSGRTIGLAESVVAATSLGLLVDASIHVLVRARDGKARNMPNGARIRYAFGAAGPALLGGFVILIAGFAVLVLSPFQGNQHLGLLTAATLAVGLPVALLVLPVGMDRR